MAVRNRGLAALTFFAALAVVHTWPLAAAPATLSRHDNADALLNEWILAWVAHVLPREPGRVFDANIFHPEPRALAFSEPLFVQALLVAPVRWAGGSPLLAFNIALIAGFALTGWTTNLIVRRWTGDAAAGLVAGSLAAFNAHTLTRLPHPQAVHVEFLFPMLWAFDRLLAVPGARQSVSLAAWYVLQALCSLYLMVFSAVALAIAALARAPEWLAGRTIRVWRALAVSGALAGIALLPVLVPYYLVSREQGLVRSIDEVALYSASWADYLSTGGRLHFALWSRRFYDATDALFPGAAALVLGAAGAFAARRDARARMLLAIAAAAAMLSFGPAFPPYRWLYAAFPPLAGIRGAARFGHLALLALAGLAGFGVAALTRRLSRRTATLGAGALVLVVNIEALRAPIQFTRVEPPSIVYDRLAAEEAAVVAEFPFYPVERIARNAPYVAASAVHWKRLVNGYSGFTPASYARHAEAFRRFPGPEALEALRALGVTHVVVHAGEAPELAGVARATPGLVPIAASRGTTLYRLRYSER